MVSAVPFTKRRATVALVNPERKRQAAGRRARKSSGAPRPKKNPAETILLGYLNPEGKHMQKSKQTTKATKPRRKKNPVTAIAARPKHHHKAQAKHSGGRVRRRRNPIGREIFSKPLEMMKLGAIAALSFFVTRQAPQLALKTRNTGWMGYLANFLTALGCAAGSGKLFGPVGGQASLVGGSMYLFSRFLNDVSPLGQTLNLAGVGDPHAAALGGLVPGYWASPVVSDRQGNPIPPDALVQAVMKRLPQPAATPAAASQAAPAVAGVGRFGARF